MLIREWLSALRGVFELPDAHDRRSTRRPVAACIQSLERRVYLSATPIGPEFGANTTTAQDQISTAIVGQSVAMDDQGNYVVTWSSDGQDGLSFGVYAQRFAADGTKLGGEFRVNSSTNGVEGAPAIAMKGNGDFVITYTQFTSQTEANVWARRYSANGTAQGAAFRVNSTTANIQFLSNIAMDENGNFVITWSSKGQDGSEHGIYAQRYTAAGAKLGGEFRVNQATAGDQAASSIAMRPTGEFLVAWTDGSDTADSKDGSGRAVYARLFAADGTPLTDEFRVNQEVAGHQQGPTVAVGPDGNFIIVWTSAGQDGELGGVFARRYGPNGVPLGNEFQVNETSAGDQVASSVAVDGAGNVVIAWWSDGQDGSGLGVFARQFDSSGNPIDGEFQVNTTTDDDQHLASVAIKPNGDFVIVWTSVGQDGSKSGVFGQRFEVANDPPVIGAFSGSVAYTEAGAPAFLAPSATLMDPDSLNFVGGVLTVTTTTNVETDDRLGIRDQGSAAGQIGVDGNQVTFGGEVIGTFSGGNGATPLVVTLNDKATPAAVQALLRNLTFSSVSFNPSVAPRTVQATLSDGDGGTSAPVTKSVTVSRVNTPPQIQGFEPAVTFTEGAGAVLVDDNAVVFEPDSLDLNTGRLTVSLTANGNANDRLTIRNQGTGTGEVGVNGTNVTYGGVIVGKFSGGTGTKALTITFNANATPEAVQAVLRNIQFSNVSAAPTTATRTVRVVLTDGDRGTSAPVTKSIHVAAVNTAPTVASFGANVNYKKGAAPIFLTTTATVSDPDSTNFDAGSLTVAITANAQPTDQIAIRNQGTGKGRIGVAGNTVTFGGVVIGTFTGGDGANPLVVTFNDKATPAAVQALLRNLTFVSLSANPSPLPRTFSVTLDDGDGDVSAPVAKNVNVVLQAPVIGGFTATGTYTENAVPLLLASSATVKDADSPSYNNGTLTISIVANVATEDRIAIRDQGQGAGKIGADGTSVTFGNAVIGTYVGGAGGTPLVVTFNGSATPAAIQALLRNLTFETVTDTPSTAPRRIQAVLVDDDGLSSAAVLKTVNVKALNDVPQVADFGGTTAYTAGGPRVLIDADAVVTDPDSPNFATGKLTIRLTKNGQSTDRLEIRSQGTASGQIGVDGANVTFSGVVIGTFTGGNGTTALVITFNASADVTSVTALLRNITFRSTSEAPSTLSRTVSVTLTDGDGGTSVAVTKTVTLAILSAGQSATYLEASKATVSEGELVTLTAFVIPPGATGTVTFRINDVDQPPVAVGPNGTATLLTSSLPPGDYTIVAEYSGDAGLAGSISPPIPLRVNET